MYCVHFVVINFVFVVVALFVFVVLVVLYFVILLFVVDAFDLNVFFGDSIIEKCDAGGAAFGVFEGFGAVFQVLYALGELDGFPGAAMGLRRWR